MSLADIQPKFNLYIRLRDAKPFSGIGLCITCGNPVHYTQADAGHFMPSSLAGTRFNGQNVHLQCRFCNSQPGGRQEEHAKAIDKLYGTGTADQLRRDAHQMLKLFPFEQKELLQKLNKEITRLKKEKNL